MVVLIVFAIIFAIVGIIGSVVPGLPGPLMSWVGMLLVFFAGKAGERPDPMSIKTLLIWLGITVLVTVLDYVIPVKTTQITGGHKAASTGAILGLIVGMIVPPVGIILGSLLGAFLGELMVNDKGMWPAFKAGAGAFLGFLLGTGLKLVTSGVMAWLIIKYAFL
jgi:uncharacterized protein YqgC (DUF456 family)